MTCAPSLPPFSSQILDPQKRAAALEIILSVVVRSEHVKDRVLASLPSVREVMTEQGYDPAFIAQVEGLALAWDVPRPRPDLRLVVDNQGAQAAPETE
jgi:hypothetical protein